MGRVALTARALGLGLRWLGGICAWVLGFVVGLAVFGTRRIMATAFPHPNEAKGKARGRAKRGANRARRGR